MHEDVLYWAAGRDQLPGPVAAEEWASVLQRVNDHRLTARLYDRIRAERPDWIVDFIEQSTLDAALSSQQVTASYKRQVERLDEVLERADASPIVLIKGLTGWANTRDNRHLVKTSDLDVLAKAPSQLKGLLIDVGYEEGMDRMPHEFANLGSGDGHWDIDLHRYFPVWRYATPARAYAPRHPYEPNRIGIASAAITAEYLLSNATNAFGTRYGRVLAPDITDCVLIRCAHVMHDYTESPYYLTGRKFRLSELAEIRDLAEREEFDHARFAEMVTRTEAWDCLHLVNQFSTLAYGKPIFPRYSAKGPEPERLPPIELCWGIIVAPNRHVEQMLAKTATLDELFDAAPPTRINLPEQANQRWTTQPSSADGSEFETILVNWSETEHATFDLQLRMDEAGLELDLVIHGPLGAFLEEVRVIFGTTHLGTGYEVSRNHLRLPPAEKWGEVRWNKAGSGCTVRMSIPMQALANKGLIVEGRISLVVALERFQHAVEDDWRAFYAANVVSTAVPIEVTYCA